MVFFINNTKILFKHSDKNRSLKIDGFKKILLITTITIVSAFLVMYALFQISKSRTYQFFGVLVNRVETTEKVVALTFDDAPTEYSDEVLETLSDKDIKATFYVIGRNIETHPDEARRIVERGHEIGNHSYTHKRFLAKPYSFITSEIEKTNDLIQNIGYNRETTFRPPNGKKLFGLPWYLKQNNIITIMWDVEPDTYVQGDADAIYDYVIANTKPGSIILMHPFCSEECNADREALPRIIDALKAEGYTFVTISKLLEYR